MILYFKFKYILYIFIYIHNNMAAVGASLVSTGDFMMDYQNALAEVSTKFPLMKDEM